MKTDSGGGGGGGSWTDVGDGYGGADGSGLIDPDKFLLTSADLDLDGVYAAGTAFTTMGARIRTRSAALATSWSPLREPGVYVAPEADGVYALMDPAVDAGEDFAERADEAAAALWVFATMLTWQNVRWRLKALEDKARDFRDAVRHGVPRTPAGPVSALVDLVTGAHDDPVEWYESLPHRKENEKMLATYAGILEDVSQAACRAAERIQEIDGLPDLADPEPYDAEAIGSTPMPWGSPRAELGMELQVLFGIGNTIKGVATGLAGLHGFSGDGWSLSTAGNAWKGLANGLLGVVALSLKNKLDIATGRGYTSPEDIERLIGSDDPLERWLGHRLRDGQSMAMPLVAGQSVDLEDAARRWKQKPWQVGTETALSWVMLFLRGPKVGKGVPMSPRARAMLDDMLGRAELVRTGSGWYTKAGIRVADETGRWLGDKLYGGTGGERGGSHMWRPGEPDPTPADGKGGKHKWEPKHRAG